MDDKLAKFKRQMWNAHRRDIQWSLSFEDWWEIWEDSGLWDNRGNKPGQAVMGRIGDTGSYSKENVEIQTNAENRQTDWNRRKNPTDPFHHTPRASGWDVPDWNWTEDFSLIRA